MTYNQIEKELILLLSEIENDEIQLESLAEKVEKANELIALCETKLRIIEIDLEKKINENKD